MDARSNGLTPSTGVLLGFLLRPDSGQWQNMRHNSAKTFKKGFLGFLPKNPPLANVNVIVIVNFL